jgi:alpha-beta hydrolase superfamily lysophospholipase
MTITQHARPLNNRLAQARSRSHGRALIFVAHSLGGILVKDALDEAKQNTAEPSDKDIIASSFALSKTTTASVRAGLCYN